MDSGQFSRARQLLNQQRPTAGQSDLRGFEWHYWQRELERSRLRSVEVPLLAAVGRISSAWPRVFSKGAARLATLIEYPSDSPLYTGAGLLVVFDGLTGRELIAPFDPCTDVRPGNRSLRMSMSNDGTRLASAVALRTDPITTPQPAQISIRDGATGSEIRRIEGPANVSEIALSADGSRLAVEYVEQVESHTGPFISGQSAVKVWDTSTSDLLQTLPLLPNDRYANRILWSPDGQRLLRQSVARERENEKSSWREQFQVVEIASGKVLWERPFPSHYSSPRRAWGWSPNGKLIVVFEVAEPDVVAKPNVQLWDSATGTILAKLDREAPSNAYATSNLAFSADSQLLAVASTTNEIYVWKIPELSLAPGASPLHVTAPYLTLQTGEEVNGVAFTADGRELQCSTATSIITLDATAREDAGLGPDFMDVAFSSVISADATKVAFGWGGSLKQRGSVWDLATNQEVFRLNTAGSSLPQPSFSPDGRRVALVQLPNAAEESLQIVIHDAQTGGLLSTIPVKVPDPSIPNTSIRAWIRQAVFRPGGQQLAAILYFRDQNQGTNQLMAWDLATGRQLFSVPISASLAAGQVYSQDGVSLIVGTRDPSGGAAEFYDAATGQRQKSISMPSSPTRAGSSMDPTRRSEELPIPILCYAIWRAAKNNCACRVTTDCILSPSVPTAVASSWERP